MLFISFVAFKVSVVIYLLKQVHLQNINLLISFSVVAESDSGDKRMAAVKAIVEFPRFNMLLECVGRPTTFNKITACWKPSNTRNDHDLRRAQQLAVFERFVRKIIYYL